MNEFKLETGTLRVTRNAELLMTITIGGEVLLTFSEHGYISPLLTFATGLCLGRVASCQNDFKIFNRNKEENDIKALRNMTTVLSDKNLKLMRRNSIILSVLNVLIPADYVFDSIKTGPTIATTGLALTSLLAAVEYAKSSYLYNKIINQEKDKSIELEKVKKLN